MKLRKLKHKKFYMYFDELWYLETPNKSGSCGTWWDTIGQSYVVNDEYGLRAYFYWEDDREYCGGSGYTEEKYTWKEFKKTLKEQVKKYNYARFWTGKCHRCGTKLTPENYEYKLDFGGLVFEDDIYYCNHCKQKQVEDAIAWYENYDEGLDNGGSKSYYE